MKPTPDFTPHLEPFSVYRLSIGDIEAIQGLLDQCLDYMLLVDGHAANLPSTKEDFQFLPPSASQENKYVYGILDKKKALVGLLDTLRGYPEEGTWWIGLLLLVPHLRSQGLGEKTVEAFVRYAKTSGAQALMLGVVEDNQRAYRFWSKVGFELVRQTEPRRFGEKMQQVNILQKKLLFEP
jgi:RimJ/RimL family protein N-acetyltransferase